MARLAVLDANVTVSVTGAAGPEPQDGMSPGTVFIATYVDGTVATVNITSRAHQKRFATKPTMLRSHNWNAHCKRPAAGNESSRR